MAIRTTEDAVRGIIAVDEDIPLTPFIETANNIIDRVCVDSGYSDATLELIERWVSAHFYAVRDPRTVQEAVKGIMEQFAIKVKDYGFNTTPYGQQALLLDTEGNLLLLDEGRSNFKHQVIHIGTNPGCSH